MKHTLIEFTICFFVLLMPASLIAQQDTQGSNVISKVKKIIESTGSSKVDTNYIQKPARPWQVSVKSRVAQTDLNMHSTINGNAVYASVLEGTGYQIEGPLRITPRVTTPISASVGIKVGYRGLSASYTFPLKGYNGQSLSFRSMGNYYSINLRWHKFEEKSPEAPSSFALKNVDVNTGEDLGGVKEYNMPGKWNLESPIKIKTLVFDGFYIFNYKRFSYGAAYNQKTIQKRSAGSLIAGIMAYYADFRFDDSRNAELITYMGEIGRIRQWQGSVGAGYAYNYVPAKGWLIGVTALPMVTLLNRMKMTQYDTNYLEVAAAEMQKTTVDDYISDYTDSQVDNYIIQKKGDITHSNRVALNFTTRLSVTYNWSRYFVNVNGQFNNFHYSHKSSNNTMHGYLNDWYINASVGVRL